jgi:hypothetical protein
MMSASAATDKVTAMGIVTDERGRPVPDANVTLIDDTMARDHFRELGSTTSDANGNFKFMNVELAGSSTLKVKVSYTYNGTTYTNRLENMQWYDASQGLFTFNKNDTKLNYYPESDHGYVWGPILDRANNGRTLDGTVYLVNNTTTLTAEASPNGYYQIEAAPGDYEIYAVHKAGDSWMVSNRTKIKLTPSYSVHESSPMMLVADVAVLAWLGPVIDQATPLPTPHLPPVPPSTQAPPSVQAAKAIPLAAAISLGLVIIIAGWAIFGRRK